MWRSAPRQVLAIIALIGVAGSGSSVQAQPRAALQAPAPKAPVTPKLLSDCDITVQSCGGSPELVGGGDGTSSGGGASVCGYGRKTVCNITVVRTCTMWKITSVSGEFSVDNLSGISLEAGAKLTCQTWATQTLEFHWT